MVLFLFVIMLLGVDRRRRLREPADRPAPARHPAGVGFVAGVFFAVRAAIGFPRQCPTGSMPSTRAATPQALAKVLFARLLLPVRGDVDPADHRGDRGDGAGAAESRARSRRRRSRAHDATRSADRRPAERVRPGAMRTSDRLLPGAVGDPVRDRHGRRAGPEERADHLHVGRAAAERREPDARRVLPDARRAWTARSWRSSPWSWRPPRSWSAWRSSCRSTGALRSVNVDDARELRC